MNDGNLQNDSRTVTRWYKSKFSTKAKVWKCSENISFSSVLDREEKILIVQGATFNVSFSVSSVCRLWKRKWSQNLAQFSKISTKLSEFSSNFPEKRSFQAELFINKIARARQFLYVNRECFHWTTYSEKCRWKLSNTLNDLFILRQQQDL